ncbi:hypothetical protein MLD38_032209 [Melastoma candidum]|uniref:Uncharacterized protein n=1 Tax=Melastoma candidum TaxID=119954 RepID=A0ACB9M567_9MYRT|nr:hypothetical protein MLD38_032209 [Melastoma candidum]
MEKRHVVKRREGLRVWAHQFRILFLILSALFFIIPSLSLATSSNFEGFDDPDAAYDEDSDPLVSPPLIPRNTPRPPYPPPPSTSGMRTCSKTSPWSRSRSKPRPPRKVRMRLPGQTQCLSWILA